MASLLSSSVDEHARRRSHPGPEGARLARRARGRDGRPPAPRPRLARARRPLRPRHGLRAGRRQAGRAGGPRAARERRGRGATSSTSPTSPPFARPWRPGARGRSRRTTTPTATATPSTACSTCPTGTPAWWCRSARAIGPSASSPWTARCASPTRRRWWDWWRSTASSWPSPSRTPRSAPPSSACTARTTSTRSCSRPSGTARPGSWRRAGAPAVREVARRARQVAETDTPVLILGETGTGKERLAAAIHSWSRARRAALRHAQLRGHPRGPAGERAVRPRQGRVHGGEPRPCRTLPDGERRDAPARRDRRAAGAAAGQAAPRAPGGTLRAGGERPLGEGGRARARRHPRGAREGDPRAALPGGPLLPVERVPAAPAPAARAAGGPARPAPRPSSRSRRAERAGADAG